MQVHQRRDLGILPMLVFRHYVSLKITNLARAGNLPVSECLAFGVRVHRAGL
jgi:hypothetical protein